MYEVTKVLKHRSALLRLGDNSKFKVVNPGYGKWNPRHEKLE